jgi:hypothetical protein
MYNVGCIKSSPSEANARGGTPRLIQLCQRPQPNSVLRANYTIAHYKSQQVFANKFKCYVDLKEPFASGWRLYIATDCQNPCPPLDEGGQKTGRKEKMSCDTFSFTQQLPFCCLRRVVQRSRPKQRQHPLRRHQRRTRRRQPLILPRLGRHPCRQL